MRFGHQRERTREQIRVIVLRHERLEGTAEDVFDGPPIPRFRLPYLDMHNRGDQASVTKLSSTRFLPACSKSISSLLPSISATTP